MDKHDINKNTMNFDIVTGEVINTPKSNIENEIIFTAIDPLKNTVNLFRNTFEYHVLGLDGMHENRSYLNLQNNILSIQRAIEKPQYILVDKKHSNRLNYLAMVELEYEEKKSIKGMHIVTEFSDHTNSKSDVVTIRPQSKVSISTDGRVMLYDVYKA